MWRRYLFKRSGTPSPRCNKSQEPTDRSECRRKQYAGEHRLNFVPLAFSQPLEIRMLPAHLTSSTCIPVLLRTSINWPVNGSYEHSSKQFTCLTKWKFKSCCVNSYRFLNHSDISDSSGHRWVCSWWRIYDWGLECRVHVLQASKVSICARLLWERDKKNTRFALVPDRFGYVGAPCGSRLVREKFVASRSWLGGTAKEIAEPAFHDS